MQTKNKFVRLFLTSAFALLFAANAYAIPKGPCDKKPADLCCEKPNPGPFGFAYPKDIGLSCPSDFYVSADYILMQAKQDGMDYAIADDDGSGQFSSNALTGGNIEGFSSNSTDWDWDSGFRANIGFYLNHDAWNLDAQWTWLQYTEDTSSSIKGSGRFLAFWLVPTGLAGIGVPQREASARWKMQYNVFDISLGKPHHVSRYFIVNPFFGIRAGWIDQNYLARYGGAQSGNTAVQDGAEANASNDFWGIGARSGIKTEWLLGAGWALYGDISGSILFSKFDLDQTVSNNNNGYTINHKFYSNTPNFEMLLGVGWNYLFNKNQHRFGLRVAYEFSHWWDINRIRRFYDGTFAVANDVVPRGDLTLSGVSFRVMFDF